MVFRSFITKLRVILSQTVFLEGFFAIYYNDLEKTVTTFVKIKHLSKSPLLTHLNTPGRRETEHHSVEY